MEFDGKVALVTGGGSGIGLATVRRLASEGARVAVLDLLPERVHEVCGSLDDAIPLVTDVSDAASMESAFATLADTAGRLDLIVANAGINGVWAPIDDLTPDEFDRTIAVNLRGTYLTLHHGVPLLRQAGGGAVVIVSSINGTRKFSTAGAVAYSAAKAGQAAMASQLALELAASGIRVNTVFPGWTATQIGQNTHHRNTDRVRAAGARTESLVPLTGPGPVAADVVADAIRMLLSSDARHVTGSGLVVDGAQSLLS